MTDAAKRITDAAAALGVTLTAEFVPLSKSRNAGDPKLNWRVSLARKGHVFLTTDYMAGVGHCPGYKQMDNSISQRDLIAFECEQGIPGFITAGGRIMRKSMSTKQIEPDAAGVIASLVLDCDVLEASGFESWADDFGYDADSIKARKIYDACLGIALKLRAAIGDEGLRALREACQDY